MKKIVSVILTIFTVILACFMCACGNNTLEFSRLEFSSDVWVITVANIDRPVDIKDRIIFESEQEKTETQISATSKDESVAKIVNGCIVPGNRFGKTKVQISTEQKEGVVEIEFISTYERLSRDQNNEINKESLLACSWFSNHRNSFKNPDSIEVLDSWTHTQNGEIDFFMLKIRGENSYGGSSIQHIILNYRGVSDGYSPYIAPYMLADGFSYASVKYQINWCIEEYKLGLH